MMNMRCVVVVVRMTRAPNRHPKPKLHAFFRQPLWAVGMLPTLMRVGSPTSGNLWNPLGRSSYQNTWRHQGLTSRRPWSARPVSAATRPVSAPGDTVGPPGPDECRRTMGWNRAMHPNVEDCLLRTQEKTRLSDNLKSEISRLSRKN